MKITQLSIKGYEKVYHAIDEKTGLNSYVVIHNTNLGPALGGCRYYHYVNEEAQLTDTLRLAKGMTYKSSLAGLNLGGGKATINSSVDNFHCRHKTTELWKSFAELLNHINGDYITASDMGTTIDDLKEISKYSNFVQGQNSENDSGIATAYGVYQSIKAVTKFLYGSDSLKSKTIAVQGLGKVGKRLIKFCTEEGAKIVATDTDTKRFTEVSIEYPYSQISFVQPDEIYEIECDVFSPCAIGGILNSDTISKLKCSGIAGGANNQLEREEHIKELGGRNIYYVPDYLANSGGVIVIAKDRNEILVDLNYDDPMVKNKLDAIYDITYEVLTESINSKQTTIEICDGLAEKRIS